MYTLHSIYLLLFIYYSNLRNKEVRKAIRREISRIKCSTFINAHLHKASPFEQVKSSLRCVSCASDCCLPRRLRRRRSVSGPAGWQGECRVVRARVGRRWRSRHSLSELVSRRYRASACRSRLMCYERTAKMTTRCAYSKCAADRRGLL